jgi:hypothetical protein
MISKENKWAPVIKTRELRQQQRWGMNSLRVINVRSELGSGVLS